MTSLLLPIPSSIITLQSNPIKPDARVVKQPRLPETTFQELSMPYIAKTKRCLFWPPECAEISSFSIK
jgi:hypothetical protein